MKTKLSAIIPVVGAVLLAGSSGADVIAGWNFSLYERPGSTVGFSPILTASYSSLDPNGAGIESQARGQLFVGSLLPTAGAGFNCNRSGSGAEGCAPPNVDGPIASNKTEPFRQICPTCTTRTFGDPSFDDGSLSILEQELGDNGNLFAMRGGDGASLAVTANTPAVGTGNRWAVSFGARMASGGGPNGGDTGCDPTPGCSGTITVDGGNPQAITLDDTRYHVFLEDVTTTSINVNLSFSGNGDFLIDNVAVEQIPLPEPGMGVSLMAGVLGLLTLRRIRG